MSAERRLPNAGQQRLRAPQSFVIFVQWDMQPNMGIYQNMQRRQHFTHEWFILIADAEFWRF
jgi:hypothetical protein